jgi:hypothetical protein
MSKTENPDKNSPSKELEITFVDDDQEGTVSLAQLAQWKSKGNYEMLEFHIRKGNIELLPRTDLGNLVALQQEHQLLINTVQKAFESIEPIFEKQEALQAYIDPDSRFKINFGKLIEEVISIQSLNPFSKKEPKPLPIVSILQDTIDTKALQEIDLLSLEQLLFKNQIAIKPFLDFLIALGVVTPDQFQKQIN